jgi:hypothetical protein
MVAPYQQTTDEEAPGDTAMPLVRKRSGAISGIPVKHDETCRLVRMSKNGKKRMNVPIILK